MAKIPYRKAPRMLVPSVALLALLGTGAAYQSINMISEEEGYVPVGYRDPVGIPTKCYGEIEDVVIGKSYSFDECERGLNAHALELAKHTKRCIPHFDEMPDKMKVALVDMTYNCGPTPMCDKNSSILRYAKAGNWTMMCKRIANVYRTAKGKLLPGLVKRRQRESQLCLEGLKEWSR